MSTTERVSHQTEEQELHNEFNVKEAVARAQLLFKREGRRPGSPFKDAAFRKKQDGWHIDAYVESGDPLTKRALLRESSSRAILKILMHECLIRQDGVMTVAFADIERLKWFNDVFGHDNANGFIVALADAINDRSNHTILEKDGYIALCFRLQGDELIVVGFGPEPLTDTVLQPIFDPVEHTTTNRLGKAQTEEVTAVMGVRHVAGKDIAPGADLDELFNKLLDEADKESEAVKYENLKARIADIIARIGEGLSQGATERGEDGSFRNEVILRIDAALIELANELGSIRGGQVGTNLVIQFAADLGALRAKLHNLNMLDIAQVRDTDRLNDKDFVLLGLKSMKDIIAEIDRERTIQEAPLMQEKVLDRKKRPSFFIRVLQKAGILNEP